MMRFASSGQAVMFEGGPIEEWSFERMVEKAWGE